MNQTEKPKQNQAATPTAKPQASPLEMRLGASGFEAGMDIEVKSDLDFGPNAMNSATNNSPTSPTWPNSPTSPGSSASPSSPTSPGSPPVPPVPVGKAWKQQLLSLGTRVLRKLIWMLIVFFGITAISFWVIHLAPGTPTDLQTTMNPFAGEEARLRLNALYGLDKPLSEQYLNWVSRLAKLDFGNSMSSDSRPVWDKIKERLPLTLGMNIASLILTLVIAVPIGIISACRQGGLFDRVSTIFVFIGFAMPGFWLALLLMMLFAIELDWLPVSGITSFDFESLSLWGKFCDLAQHLAMPLFVYTFGSLAAMSRFMRSSMLEVLRQDYITTARAKGLPWRKVIGKHALRNALLPLITLLGLSIPGLIGGSVIIESIFALPGLGQLFYGAVLARDYPLIMGNLVLGAMLTLAGNMLADLAYGIADPRIRRGAKI